MLRNLEHAGDPWGRGAPQRLGWTEPLDFDGARPRRRRREHDPRRRGLPVLGRLRRRARRQAPSGPPAPWRPCCTRPGSSSWCSVRASPAPATPPAGWATSSSSRCSPSRTSRSLERGRRPPNRRHLRALLQHPGQRVPPGRRPLRGGPPHRRCWPRSCRGPAGPGGAGRRDGHLPRPVLPGPAQPDLRRPARAARRDPRRHAHRDAAQPGAVVLLRCRRRPDVDGRDPRHTDQPQPHRRGARSRARPRHRRLPVLPDHARRRRRPAPARGHRTPSPSRCSTSPRCCCPRSDPTSTPHAAPTPPHPRLTR